MEQAVAARAGMHRAARKCAVTAAAAPIAVAAAGAIDAGQEDDVEMLIASRRKQRQEKSAGFCPKCGRPVQKSDKFCSNCGTVVS